MTAEQIKEKVRAALDIETRPLFPALYEAFLEVDALAQGEDALLNVLRQAVWAYFQNRNMQTLTEAAAVEFENGLGLSHSGTIEERRAAIMEAINKDSSIEVAELLEIAREAAESEAIQIGVDPVALIMRIYTENEGTDAEKILAARAAVAPLAPQNLKLSAEESADSEVLLKPYLTLPINVLFTDAGVAAEPPTIYTAWSGSRPNANSNYVRYYGHGFLYDENGNQISWQGGTYKLYKLYKADGTEVQYGNGVKLYWYDPYMTGARLALKNESNEDIWCTKVEYTIT